MIRQGLSAESQQILDISDAIKNDKNAMLTPQQLMARKKRTSVLQKITRIFKEIENALYPPPDAIILEMKREQEDKKELLKIQKSLAKTIKINEKAKNPENDDEDKEGSKNDKEETDKHMEVEEKDNEDLGAELLKKVRLPFNEEITNSNEKLENDTEDNGVPIIRKDKICMK